MALVVDPYTFANGQVADALQVNARIAAILAGVNGGLDNTNIVAGAGIDGAKLLNASISNAKLATPYPRPPVVTALPGAPADTDEIYFQTPNDPFTGYPLFWHCRYRAASGKWDVIGGPSPLVSQVATAEHTGTANATYNALATAGPAIAIPVAGDYDVSIGAYITVNTNRGGLMSYDIGGTGAVDADCVQHEGGNSGVNNAASVMRTMRKLGLTAVTLTAKYRLDQATDATYPIFANRFMRVTPVRLG